LGLDPVALWPAVWVLIGHSPIGHFLAMGSTWNPQGDFTRGSPWLNVPQRFGPGSTRAILGHSCGLGPLWDLGVLPFPGSVVYNAFGPWRHTALWCFTAPTRARFGLRSFSPSFRRRPFLNFLKGWNSTFRQRATFPEWRHNFGFSYTGFGSKRLRGIK